MSERFDFGDPASYGPSVPTQPEPHPDAWPAPAGAWDGPASSQTAGFPPRYQPGTYPPPPEFYLPHRQPGALPAVPAEHAAAVPYPAFAPDVYAPDGHIDPSRLHGAATASVAQPRAASGLTFLGVLLSLGSAFVSVFLYAAYASWQFNLGLDAAWEFGVGLVLLLLIHEMGHFVVIRAKGLPAALPVFIPFLGAYVAMRRLPRTVRDEAEIALAGPLAGALAGAACFLLYPQVGGAEGHLLLFLAYFSFFINLLNLIPVSPLDGGHIVGAISRWLWPIGLLLLIAAFFYTWNLLLLLLAWLWVSQTIARFRTARRQPYYTIRFPTRLYIAALYFGLAAGLAGALYVTQSLLFAGGGWLGL